MSESPTAAGSDAAWSDLWARTSRGSIDLDAPDDPVAQALRDHWVSRRGWLAGLQQVVDVGSGPAVLARHLRGRPGPAALDGLVWWCVDAAALPLVDSPTPGLHCLGQTDFASAQPPQGPCDGIVSNFGLEYVPRQGLAAACARWLAPGARLDAVAHARGSVIDLTACQTLADIEEALDGVRLFEHARRLLEAARTLPADPALRRQHGLAERHGYNRAVESLKASMEVRGQASAVWIDMLQALTQLVQRAVAGQAESSAARCASLESAYRAERQRLQAMRSSALGPSELEALAAAFREAGLSQPEWREIRAAAGLVAWHLSSQRTS